jgi:hypothetical protein
MSFLTPVALALLALSIPILLLWMLKLRRRDVTVSSTMLWSKLLRDREANAPWQRLRRNLLLFLQLAILAALVLALARPSIPVPAVASGAVVVLLDASASMNATDVEPSRFAVAQRAAEEMVRGLSGDGIMTVIAVGSQPQVLAAATNDKAVLRQAIAAAQPEQSPADWVPAFALAAGATSGLTESTIVIISDGNLSADLPPLPGEVHYLPIGRETGIGREAGAGGTENLAITALAAREGIAGPELFINIANTSPPAQGASQSLVSVYLDGVLYESHRIDVPAGEALPLTITGLPAGVSIIEARLAVEDALALDNTAWAVVRPGGERRALLVSPGNLFLERAIASLPEVNAFRTGPDGVLPAEPYDLTILDGAFPPDLPDGPLLIVNPPPGNPLLAVSGTFSNTQLSRVFHSELLDHVDFSQVQILEAQRVQVPPWANVLIAADGGPLLLVGEPGGRRVAVLTFDLHKSDLPLLIAFPVLMANLVDWLTPGLPFDAGDGLHPGEPLTLYPGDAEVVRVLRPDESAWTVDVEAQLSGVSQLVFAGTEQLGLFRVELDGDPAGQFAVNLFNPAESALTRQETIFVGRAEVAPTGEQELGQWEFWPWLAATALLILLIEWWVYHRGMRPRAPEPL